MSETAVETTIEQCNTCRFWQRMKLNEGICRRHPPLPVVIPLTGKIMQQYLFPMSRGDIWCGDYQQGTPKDSIQ